MKLLAPPVLAPIKGTQISYADWNQLVAFMSSLSSLGLSLQQGVTDALPPIQPLSVAFPGGMAITIGGADANHPQWALCQGLLCAAISPTPFTVPSNATGSTRVDAIVCQPASIQTTTVSRPVEQDGGSKPVENIPVVIQGLAFQYVTGPSGGGNPSIPSGWELFAYLNVANGAVAVDATDLVIQFPFMNPNAFTVTTTSTTVPTEGSNVTLNVNDTSVWADGDFGYCVGPHSDNGFLFQVITGGVNADALQLTVVNVNTTINGSGNMPIGALVLPAGIAPVVCSIDVTNIPSTIGASFTIDVSNPGAFTENTFGIITGRVHGKGAYFSVTSTSGATLTCVLIGLAQGGTSLLGSTLLPGSTVTPGVPPGIIEEDQDNGGFLNPTQASRTKFGSLTFASAGSQTVSFATGASYTNTSTYKIFFSSNTAGVNPIWGSKGAGGFQVTAAAAGTVEWMTVGY